MACYGCSCLVSSGTDWLVAMMIWTNLIIWERMKDTFSIQICMSHCSWVYHWAFVLIQATHHSMLFLFVFHRWNKSQTHYGLSYSITFWQALLIHYPTSHYLTHHQWCLGVHRGRSWFVPRDQLRHLLTLSKWFYLWVYAAPVRFFSDDNHSKQIYCTWSKRVIILSFVLHVAALGIISYHVVSPESITFSQRGDVQHQWTVSTISSSVPS